MTSLQKKIDTEFGPLYLVAGERGLQGAFWQAQAEPLWKSEKGPAADMLRKAIQQFEEYFAGQRTEFDLPLDVQGTPFQKVVWKKLGQIPYGTTWSYKELAVAVGKAKACRAVGSANGRNPLNILVPCHRVIASNGSLGGYGGGLPRKKKLLEFEKRIGRR